MADIKNKFLQIHCTVKLKQRLMTCKLYLMIKTNSQARFKPLLSAHVYRIRSFMVWFWVSTLINLQQVGDTALCPYFRPEYGAKLPIISFRLTSKLDKTDYKD